jgi:hypothetical protein
MYVHMHKKIANGGYLKIIKFQIIFAFLSWLDFSQ